MQTEDGYTENIAIHGTSLYYSLLFLPEQQKQGLKHLYALFHEINKISENFHEENLARVKLAWWKNEIDNLYTQKPTHPLTKALIPYIREWKLPLQLFLEYIEGQLLKFEVSHCCTEKDFELYAYRNSGIPYILSSYVIAPESKDHIFIANQIGVCLEIINLIIELRCHARLGRIYFPQTAYEQMGLCFEDFLTGNTSDKLCLFFESQREKAHQIFKTSVQPLNRTQKKSFGHLITLAKIKLTQLDETARADYPVFTSKICLTALRKLWISLKIHFFAPPLE